MGGGSLSLIKTPGLFQQGGARAYFFLSETSSKKESEGEGEVRLSEMPLIPVESSLEGECLVCVKLKD